MKKIIKLIVIVEVEDGDHYTSKKEMAEHLVSCINGMDFDSVQCFYRGEEI